jgi:hypothetical protein
VVWIGDSVDLIRGTRAAFIAPEFYFYPNLLQMNYSQRFLCDELSVVSGFRGNAKTAMVLKKGSPFKEIFNLK